MNLKFKDSILFQNFSLYSVPPSRVNAELLLIFKLIQYFQFENILEIGFREGKTFGALLEAMTQGEITAVDNDFQMHLYDKLYKNSKAVLNKKIQLVDIDSTKFRNFGQKYDFINVDGDHTMPVVFKDICFALKEIAHNGIIMLDDFAKPDVDLAIDQFLKHNQDFIPFLMGEQSVFFHHMSTDLSYFLDVELKKIFASFADISDIIYKDFQIKKISVLPAITAHDDIFSLICERYEL